MATKQIKTEVKKEVFRDSEGRLIQNLPDRIKHSELKTIEVVGNPDILEEMLYYLTEILPELSTTFHEVLDLIGLNSGKYSEEDLHYSSFWVKGTAEQKEAWTKTHNFSPEKIAIFDEIIQNDIDKTNRLFQFIIKLAVFWGGKDNKKHKEQAFNMISTATGLSLTLLKASDYTILAELFLSILIKPSEDWDLCVNLKKNMQKLLNGLSL